MAAPQKPVGRPPKPSGIEVVRTYFSRVKSGLEPGVGSDGRVLDAQRFVNHYDKDGNRLPVEFRWGSTRAGCPESNAIGGFVEARIDPQTRELDADGKPVVIQAPRGGAMHLLVRPTGQGSVSEAREAHKQDMIQRTMKKKRQDIGEELRDRYAHSGLAIEPSISEHEETVSMPVGQAPVE